MKALSLTLFMVLGFAQAAELEQRQHQQCVYAVAIPEACQDGEHPLLLVIDSAVEPLDGAVWAHAAARQDWMTVVHRLPAKLQGTTPLDSLLAALVAAELPVNSQRISVVARGMTVAMALELGDRLSDGLSTAFFIDTPFLVEKLQSAPQSTLFLGRVDTPSLEPLRQQLIAAEGHCQLRPGAELSLSLAEQLLAEADAWWHRHHDDASLRGRLLRQAWLEERLPALDKAFTGADAFAAWEEGRELHQRFSDFGGEMELQQALSDFAERLVAWERSPLISGCTWWPVPALAERLAAVQAQGLRVMGDWDLAFAVAHWQAQNDPAWQQALDDRSQADASVCLASWNALDTRGLPGLEAQQLYGRAMALMRLDRHLDAARLLAQIISEHRPHALVLSAAAYQLACCQAAMGHEEAARAGFELTLETFPELARRYRHGARVLADRNPLHGEDPITQVALDILRGMDSAGLHLGTNLVDASATSMEQQLLADMDRLIALVLADEYAESSSSECAQNAASDSSLRISGGPGAVVDVSASGRSFIGHLPEHERAAVEQLLGGDLPAGYRELIEQYYADIRGR